VLFRSIQPDETATLQRIPRALLFPAPGLPRGHMLMGYGDNGCCPMLVDNECSIYEDRPQTCRDYDCRVFTATAVAVDPAQVEIANRVKAWAFEYESEESREEQRVVKEAAAFLRKSTDLFPQGSIPSYPVQLAALAIRTYGLFSNTASGKSDAFIANAILRAVSNPDSA
jgi:uncharacterized protein